MQLLVITVSILTLALAAVSIVDLVRRGPGAVAMAGWILLIVIVPFVGSIVYWLARPASSADAEQAYRAQQDQRRV